MSAIRLASADDAPILARMRYEFRAAIHDATEDEGPFVARCAAWMGERLVDASAWHCWVFEMGGDVAGQLWLQLIEKMPNPAEELETHGYITNVYVRPVARGAGAGEQLLRTALAFCREQRVDSVLLWPTPRSRTLYARHGFAVEDDVMELRLGGGR
ncbi:MAG: GNAT family N-acetyltransferase [Tepidiformaceae bacterium]